LAGSVYVEVINLSFTIERVHAAELSQLRRLLSSDDSDVREVLRSPTAYRSLPPRPIRRMLIRKRCRSIAVHPRWCRILWPPATLMTASQIFSWLHS